MSKSGSTSSRRRIGFAGAGVVLSAALALSACGSSSKGATSQRQRSSPAVKLSLVAYSTPQAAYKELIAAFQKTPAGKNITFSQSYGASGDQSRAVVKRPEGRRRRVLARARHDPPGQGHAGRRRPGTRDQYKGNDHRLHRGARHPQGQPEAHQGLERPDQARRLGHRAEPGHLRWRALGRHGRLRHAVEQGRRQDRRRRLPEEALQERRRCRTTAPARRCRPSPTARATSSSPTRTTRSSPSRRASRSTSSSPSGDDPDREPDRRDHGDQAPEARPRLSWTSCTRQQAQEIFADNGYRPVVSGVTSSKVTFATPPGLFTIKDLGGWTDGDERPSSTPTRAS